MDYCTLYVTARNTREANRIGLSLVEDKLAACVNYFRVHSIYRWQGKIEENAEIALLIKTRKSLAEKAIARIKALHSYEVPCIETWNIDGGYLPYLQWISDSTGQEEP